jgi:hypothetical protein
MQSDIHDGVLIPFSSREKMTNIVCLVLLIFSSAADCLAIYALVKQRYIPLDSRYLLSIVCADLFFVMVFLVVFGINGNVGQNTFTS